MTTPPQRIKIVCHDLNIRRTVDVGKGPVVPTSGYGGWQEVTRPNNLSMTQWLGVSPLRMDVPIMLDGYRKNDSIAPELNDILSLGLNYSKKGRLREPPTFTISGTPDTPYSVPFPGLDWVVENILFGTDEGDVLRDEKNGVLIRQHLTLQVLQYVDPDEVILGGKGHGKGKTLVFRVTKTVNTCVKIALLVFKDREEAREIAKMNGIRDVNAKLKVGRLIKVPPASDKDDKKHHHHK